MLSFDFDKCLESGRELQERGISDEEILQYLRQEGASMMESVKLIRRLRSIPLRQAQDLVRCSAVWKDHKESHDALQETFAEALWNLSQEEN